MSEDKVERNSEFIPVPGFGFETPVIEKKMQQLSMYVRDPHNSTV